MTYRECRFQNLCIRDAHIMAFHHRIVCITIIFIIRMKEMRALLLRHIILLYYNFRSYLIVDFVLSI